MSHADEQIAKFSAAGEWVAVRRWERVRARVDQAPPIEGALRDQLAVLLRPVPVEPVIPRLRRRAEPQNAKAA